MYIYGSHIYSHDSHIYIYIYIHIYICIYIYTEERQEVIDDLRLI